MGVDVCGSDAYVIRTVVGPFAPSVSFSCRQRRATDREREREGHTHTTHKHTHRTRMAYPSPMAMPSPCHWSSNSHTLITSLR